MPFHCSVCFEALDEQPQQNQVSPNASNEIPLSDLVLTRCCGHIVHRSCLSGWLSRPNIGNNKCPRCAKQIKMNDVISVFPDIGLSGNDLNTEEDIVVQPLDRGDTKSSSCFSISPCNYRAYIKPKIRNLNKKTPQCSPCGVAHEKCFKAGCKDFLVVHRTLVSDYDELVEKSSAHDQSISKETMICTKIEQQIDTMNKTVELQQKRISTLLKRPKCTCTLDKVSLDDTADNVEDDSDDDNVEDDFDDNVVVDSDDNVEDDFDDNVEVDSDDNVEDDLDDNFEVDSDDSDE